MMLMKRKPLALTLVMALVFSFLFWGTLVQPAESQSFENIYIRADGSVEGTDKIQRNGNVYTLTGNISGSIQVQRSHIVINGAGYAVKGNGEGRGIDLSNGRGQDPSRPKIINATVKNLKILNFQYSIDNANTGDNTFIGNYIENYEGSCGASGFWIAGSSNNNITQNTMVNACIEINYAGSNSITENNFINSWIHIWLSTPPTVDRNYWSDYSIKYPVAKEISDSGIWDTPYYDERLGGWADNHPLVEPVSVISDFPAPSPSPSPTSIPTSPPTPQPTATPSPSPSISPTPEPQPEPFPTAVVAASVASVAIVSVGLLVYFKKRKR